MLGDGEISLLAGAGGLAEVDAVAHALDLVTVSLVRSETDPARQEQTVMVRAGGLPLIWIAAGFGEEARAWAQRRGPMTLLVENPGPLSTGERERIDRFVALLGRQAE